MTPAGEGAPGPAEPEPAKKKLLFSQDRAKTKKVSLDGGPEGPFVTMGSELSPEQEEERVAFL